MLKLYWEDINNNKYHIANLDKKDSVFMLDILEDNLKKATHNGCMGISGINLLANHHESDKLFAFFANRIPSRDYRDIDEFLKKYQLEDYDEMEILKKTSGRLLTDRYYIEA